MKQFFIILSIILFISCGKKNQEIPDGILVSYGEEILTLQEVEEMIPNGLLPADSVAIFYSIVDSWIKDRVIADFAEERLYDIDRIERKVKDYRNSLIVQEYIIRMLESQNPRIDEQRVKEYYDNHRSELKLEVPLIRGIFIKINSDARGKETIKTLLKGNDLENIDQLEREWLDRALEYNYFRDKWIDWNTLESMIPYRFGDPDNFVKENSFFETDYDDCSYYLQISDYLLSGEEQPYEFARGWIQNLMTQGDLAEYERVLVNSLLQKSIKEKKLIGSGYDPIKHELKKNSVK